MYRRLGGMLAFGQACHRNLDLKYDHVPRGPCNPNKFPPDLSRMESCTPGLNTWATLTGNAGLAGAGALPYAACTLTDSRVGGPHLQARGMDSRRRIGRRLIDARLPAITLNRMESCTTGLKTWAVGTEVTL